MLSWIVRFAWVVIAWLLLVPAPSTAQAPWPTKPVRIVVPFPPGGSTDFFARMLAPELQLAFGQPFVVVNGPGAGGIVSTAEVASSPGDGYTLLMGTVGTHAINASLYARLPYDPIKDFVPVTLVALTPNVLVMNAERAREYGIDSVPSLIRYARAHPGALNLASGGNGTSQHLAGELFKRMTGTYMVHIPYRGSSHALMALLGNDVDLMFEGLISALPFIKSGRLIALAVTTARRSESAPDIPTMQEAGGPELEGYDAGAWHGLFAPAGTPVEVVVQLQREVSKALSLPGLRASLVAQGTVPAGTTSAEFAAYIAQETAKWAQVVKFSRARVD